MAQKTDEARLLDLFLSQDASETDISMHDSFSSELKRRLLATLSSPHTHETKEYAPLSMTHSFASNSSQPSDLVSTLLPRTMPPLRPRRVSDRHRYQLEMALLRAIGIRGVWFGPRRYQYGFWRTLIVELFLSIHTHLATMLTMQARPMLIQNARLQLKGSAALQLRVAEWLNQIHSRYFRDKIDHQWLIALYNALFHAHCIGHSCDLDMVLQCNTRAPPEAATHSRLQDFVTETPAGRVNAVLQEVCDMQSTWDPKRPPPSHLLQYDSFTCVFPTLLQKSQSSLPGDFLLEGKHQRPFRSSLELNFIPTFVPKFATHEEQKMLPHSMSLWRFGLQARCHSNKTGFADLQTMVSACDLVMEEYGEHDPIHTATTLVESSTPMTREHWQLFVAPGEMGEPHVPVSHAAPEDEERLRITNVLPVHLSTLESLALRNYEMAFDECPKDAFFSPKNQKRALRALSLLALRWYHAQDTVHGRSQEVVNVWVKSCDKFLDFLKEAKVNPYKKLSLVDATGDVVYGFMEDRELRTTQMSEHLDQLEEELRGVFDVDWITEEDDIGVKQKRAPFQVVSRLRHAYEGLRRATETYETHLDLCTHTEAAIDNESDDSDSIIKQRYEQMKREQREQKRSTLYTKCDNAGTHYDNCLYYAYRMFLAPMEVLQAYHRVQPDYARPRNRTQLVRLVRERQGITVDGEPIYMDMLPRFLASLETQTFDPLEEVPFADMLGNDDVIGVMEAERDSVGSGAESE